MRLRNLIGTAGMVQVPAMDDGRDKEVTEVTNKGALIGRRIEPGCNGDQKREFTDHAFELLDSEDGNYPASPAIAVILCRDCGLELRALDTSELLK